MNWKAFSELLANWEFREESDPIRVVCDVVRLTHIFISTREDWETATQSDFLMYADTVASAVSKRNANERLTSGEQKALTIWDDAAIVPLSKQWDTIPEFRRIQFDDGRIRTACQLLSRIQRYENAGQSDRQCLLLSIGYLTSRLVRLQNKTLEDRVGKRAACQTSPPAQAGTRKTTQRLKPITRHTNEPAKSATVDATEADRSATRRTIETAKNAPRESATSAATIQRDRDDFARVLDARDQESRLSRSRRITEVELRAVLARPTPGKTALLAAASHFGVSTKAIRWRAAEYGIDI